MTTKYILPYNMSSAAARSISQALKINRIKRTASSPEIKGGIIINWGCPERLPRLIDNAWINDPAAVNQVANKKSFFETVSKKNSDIIPYFTTSPKEALAKVKEGMTLVARTKLRAKEGAGIIFLSDGFDEWVNADLYTQYIPKIAEFRVHVWRKEVLDLQKKVLRKTWPDGTPVDKTQIDFRIRNYKGGFIFQRNNISVPNDVVVKALRAMACFNLEFGAVDVVYNEHQNRAYVLEINTAPGIEGETLNKYVEVFSGL